MIEFYRKMFAAADAMYRAHAFDRAATGPILAFEFFILALAGLTLWWLWRNEKKGVQIFFLAAGGLFIHQFFTSPMWHNYRMGWAAYIYQDISWISTLAWASMIMAAITLVDRYFKNLKDWQRFPLYLALLAPAAMAYETVLLKLGVSGYSPEAQQAMSGWTLLGTPVEGFVYVPVFMALVVSFTKYWSFYVLEKPVIPLFRRPWLRSFLICLVSVFLFELTVEPMVDNVGFPAWSYIYRDISVLLTGAWVALVWLAINLVDKYLIHFDLRKKFIAYLAVVFIAVLPVELWLMLNGYRVYGPSTTAAFTGMHIPWTTLPMEVAFGIPLYFALILSFVKYWEIILDNR
ncbi:MAG TPA: hypothetical protein PKI19_02990 [Elusimicrobiales bacterium]|nr:hypothetical protein [Elusimicrobiales bacterium]